MHPRKVVLLLSPAWYGAGRERLRLLELPLDVWGYRVETAVEALGDGELDAVVVCAPSVPHVVDEVRPVLERWPWAQVLVVGPFGGPEREALAAVGIPRVLEETPAVLQKGGALETMARFREMLRLAVTRRRGPQATRVAGPLAPLAVQMERAA